MSLFSASRFPAALLCLLCSAAPAFAAPVFDLGSIEVIGESPPAAAHMTTETFDADTLAAWHRDDLAAALDRLPGVVLQDAGQRRERLIAIRGFSSRQVPLFIDGVPVYVPYDGIVDFARFGVDGISEIVVAKGLASLLYGPNVLGGAVNVLSRRPQQPLEAALRAGYEIDDHGDTMDRRLSARLGGVRNGWYAQLGTSWTDSDGFRLPGDFAPVAAEDGARRENAHSRDRHFNAKLGYLTAGGDEYALSYYRQDGDKQVPPYAGSYLRSAGRPDGVQVRWWRWPDWNKQGLSFVALNGIGTQGTLRWRLYHDRFYNELDSYDDATYTAQTRPYSFADSVYDDDSYGGSADLEWRWSATHVSRVAVHGRQDIHRESDRATPQERLEMPTWDVAAEHEWKPAAGWTLTPGYAWLRQSSRTVRVYDADLAGFVPVPVDAADAHNAQLVATWSPLVSGTFVAGVSRKTRFPTLKERFSGGLGSAVPNPALRPENALHYELGWKQRGERWRLDASVFLSDLDDAIETVTVAPDACAAPPCTQLLNIGEQRNHGLEFGVTLQPLDTLELLAQFSLLDRDNRSSPQVHSVGTPSHKLLVAADWRFLPRWTLRADAQREGARNSNSGGTRVAEAFTRINAFLRYEPVENLGFELGGRNLGDRLYAYDEGYYQSGRSWLAQVDWRYTP